jgi:hypothetical protein
MFSADNQKRLTGPGTEVPIFEAKMTGDSRLVVRRRLRLCGACRPDFSSVSNRLHPGVRLGRRRKTR